MPRHGAKGHGLLTIDSALESLPADLAFEVAHSAFLVYLDRHRLLVVAEEAGEDGREGFILVRRRHCQ